MSNMLRKGKRLKARETKKEVKHRTKDFYAIMGELERLANILKEDETVTPDNFVERAQSLSDRIIEPRSMESFILRGKLGFFDSMQEDIPEKYKVGIDPYEDGEDNT